MFVYYARGALIAYRQGTSGPAPEPLTAIPRRGYILLTRRGPAQISWRRAASAAAITGTVAATESGADAAALAGDIFVLGSLAATEAGSDTAAISGSQSVAGSLAATESGADTATLAGDVLVQGALAATESGADTAAINGSNAIVQGMLAAVESGDTCALAGQILVSGSLAATETGADTAAFEQAPVWPLLAARGVSAHGHGSARPEQRSTATRRNVQ